MLPVGGRVSASHVTGVILAGGPASRFDGLPKGLQTVGGERIIDRVARGLRLVTNRLVVISNDPQSGEWLPGATVEGDLLPSHSSLIGIHAALSRAGGDVIVVAWDMPFVPVSLLEEIARRLASGAIAVVPIGPRGPEPVCAAYAAAALPFVEGMVAERALRLSGLIDALPGADRIPLATVARFGDPDVMFFNVNSPADRERAEAIARAL